MAKENKEVVEKTTEQPIEEVVDKKIEEQPRNEKGQFKSKNKIKDDGIIKVDLSKPPPVKEEVVEEKKENVVEKPEVTEEVIEQPVMEEIVEKEPIVNKEVTEEIPVVEKQLPENVQKLVDFMSETGGDINDYVQLNRDIKEMDDSDVLDEYYKQTKSHVTPEERSYLLEDNYGVDEELDDEKGERKKKRAIKEQVAEDRANIDRQKSKDDDSIQVALMYCKNFVSQFANEDHSNIEDSAGYHKSLFTAMNADAIAKHFYEQGKADAVKDTVARDKNINLEPRKTHGEYEAGGIKVKALGVSSSDIKNRSFKIRKKN